MSFTDFFMNQIQGSFLTEYPVSFTVLVAFGIFFIFLILYYFESNVFKNENFLRLSFIVYIVLGLFYVLIMFKEIDFKKNLRVSLGEEYFFSFSMYAEGGKVNDRSFIVYKVNKTESIKTVTVWEKQLNGLVIEKNKKEKIIEEDIDVVFKTSCDGYSINQCVEKVKELLKDKSYAKNLNSNKEIKL